METAELLAALGTAFVTALRLVAPMLLLSMLVGIVIAIFQAATQIHEQTLTFLPKLFIIIFVLLITGDWMITTLIEFARDIFELMANG